MLLQILDALAFLSVVHVCLCGCVSALAWWWCSGTRTYLHEDWLPCFVAYTLHAFPSNNMKESQYPFMLSYMLYK